MASRLPWWLRGKNPHATWETWVQSLVGKIPWRRERLPTPEFWPGEFHGLYSPWGHKQSDVTETFTFMASIPITSWQIEWEKVETVTDFIFLGSQITVEGECSHEIERGLLLGRKAMTNLDSRLKSKGITLPKKECIVSIMVFPVVMYGCESWTIKKTEHRRIDALNCGAGEDSWESLGLQGDQISQS